MQHKTHAIASLVVGTSLAALASCNALFGVDELDYDGRGSGAAGVAGMAGHGGATGGAIQTTSTTTTGSGGSPVSCGDGRLCTIVPPGWNGPVLLAEQDIDSDQPSCLESTAPVIEGFAGLSAEGGCTGCTCEPVCTPDAAIFYEESTNCTGAVEVWFQGSCAGFPYTIRSVELHDPITTCTTDGGDAALEPPSWSTRATICSAATTADPCPGGGYCTEAGTAPFAGAPCVWQLGSVDCPAGFAPAGLYYGGVSDSRHCSLCHCEVAEACGVDTILNVNTGCMGAEVRIGNSPEGCHDTSAYSFDWAHTEVYAPGACNVTTQAQVIGAATPTGDFTVCCLP